MRIEACSKGVYKIVRIEEPLKVIGDLSELKAIIEGYVENDDVHVAVNFSDASYLYSGAISVLISCYRIIRERQGDLCIVEPNKGLLELLKQMNIDEIIRVYSSEEELPSRLPDA